MARVTARTVVAPLGVSAVLVLVAWAAGAGPRTWVGPAAAGLLVLAAGAYLARRATVAGPGETRPAAAPLEYHDALLNSRTQGIVVIGADRTVIEVNPAFERLTGFAASDVVGTGVPFPWLPPDAGTPFLDRLRTRLLNNELYLEEIETFRADGSSFPSLLTVTPVLDPVTGAPRAFIGMLFELTESMRARDGLAAQAIELTRANLGLAEASQLNSDIMAMLSHDMKQPLTVINGYASLLQSRWPELSERRRLSAVTELATAGRGLTELVGNMLSMFRLDTLPATAADPPRDAGGPAGGIRPIDPAPVALLAIAAAHGVGEPEPATLDAGPDGAGGIRVDPAHLRQMLVNLLTNAVKYGAPPVGVVIRADRDTVRITVADCGTGVPEAFVPHLFDRFTRADEVTAAGSGLGLFIIDKLARANGGTVHYEPHRPTGSCFVLTFPRADRPGSPAGSPLAAAHPPARR